MIKLNNNRNDFCDLALLERENADPDISQSDLAQDLSIAIGTVNRRLQQLVKTRLYSGRTHAPPQLRYTLTPKGRTLYRTLTQAYIKQSFDVYRQVRQQVKDVLKAVTDAGITTVRLNGEGDVRDVCRLTCLEYHVKITNDPDAQKLWSTVWISG